MKRARGCVGQKGVVFATTRVDGADARVAGKGYELFSCSARLELLACVGLCTRVGESCCCANTCHDNKTVFQVLNSNAVATKRF